jgi:isopenicillin-N epimerase
VNAVVRSLDLAPGHELLALDQGYNACLNVLRHAAARSGARLVLAAVPFPLASEEEAVEAVLRAASPRTRLALVDHVASPTGLVLPVARIVRALEGRGVPVLVDGAHAPGMVPLDLASVGASYYAGNCHKWLCAPKGAGFLHVRRELQAAVRPAVISHGANSPRADRSRFLVEFDWVGTTDPTAVLSIPAALRFMGSLLPGGWPEVMRRNRALALEARALLASALGAAPPAPDSMVGSLAALRLPDGTPAAPRSPLYQDALQDALLERFGIEVPVVPWPAPPRRLLRISAQLYNDLGDYQRLAAALGELLG